MPKRGAAKDILWEFDVFYNFYIKLTLSVVGLSHHCLDTFSSKYQAR